jgi:ABC-2 type transport system permease protein
MVEQKQKKPWNDISRVLIWLGIIVLVNFFGSFVFHRFDLTSEKRFSLSPASIDLVKNLEDVVFVRVYLDGELPSEFKRLKDATKEMLDEFRAYSRGQIEYEFIDPSESPDEKERIEVYKKLTKEGLQYNNIRVEEADKISEKIIFPGAVFAYQAQSRPLQLLKSQMGVDKEVMINTSIQQLEYEISSTIRKMVNVNEKRIAFIDEYSALDELQTIDMINALKDFYTVDRVKIKARLNALKGYTAAIIVAPSVPVSEKDKFILDQFIMKGGKVMWLIDPVMAHMDSMNNENNHTFMALAQQHNLDDMLFKYGVRLNADLIQDLQAFPIPIVTGYVGNKPRQELFPWPFFPMVMPKSSHPIVKNLDPILFKFASTIDTLGDENIRKKVLLQSSQYTKVVNAPTRVSVNMLKNLPDERQFVKGNKAVAVLLEGSFTSVFKNRIPPAIQQDEEINFKDKSLETKMLVVSDADVIINDVRKGTNEFFALGYYRFTNQIYANKSFILNAINYLCDDSGLLEARSKEFKIRLLDKQRVAKEKYKWQLINTVVPIVLILLFGLVKYYIRTKRYSKQQVLS